MKTSKGAAAAPPPTKKKNGRGVPVGVWTKCTECSKLMKIENAVTFQGKRYHAIKCFDAGLAKIVAKVRELFDGVKL